MAVLSVELDDETVEALEVERGLLGFKNRAAYVQWIVDNRAAIDPETEDVAILERCHERRREAEDRLEAVDTGSTGAADAPTADADRSPTADAPTADAESEADTAVDGGSLIAMDDPWATDPNDPAMRVNTIRPETAESVDRDERSPEEPPAASRSTRPSTRESAADPQSTTEREPDTETARPSISAEAAAAGITAVNLKPERTARISEDKLAEDADVLDTVATERLDELSRRAVAKTRKRLDREVETGLSYASQTSIAAADSDVRPGEDVVDLETLSVPGRSADLVERRQEVAGRAIAFLRDRGDARRADFVEALYEEWPAGYETTDSWWRCLKTVFEQVDVIDGGAGSRVWRYTPSSNSETFK